MAKKIMVVEHNPEFQLKIKETLEQAGYEVITSKSGINALSRLEAEKPEMVLTTDTMPGVMTGLQLAHKIKFNPDTNHILVFLLIEDWNPETIQAAIRTGAEGYETRSFDYLTLVAQVETTFQS